MFICTVTGYKGGIGKSTTAIHLSAILAEKGRTLLVDGDPNRTCLAWSRRGELPFKVEDERKYQRLIREMDYLVIDTPARPESDDLKTLAEGCDLLILPTTPDVVSLEPTLEITGAVDLANYRLLITLVPPPPNKQGEELLETLKKSDIPVFNSMIRRTVSFPQAAEKGVLVHQVGKRDKAGSDAWNDYKKVGEEILNFWENKNNG
ncbi:MAG: ParA family protein [Pyrinomonadaceae bacterium]|nr:ParA family protein [Pyrinomonadaceae bacterium]